MNLGVRVVDFNKDKDKVTSRQSLTTNHQSLNTKYRAQIRKGAEIAVLSHLDYMNVFMRALLRSKLPAAWSEGFNPHLKVSFANALAVGVTSESEYVDFELTEPLNESEVMTRLNRQLPKGAEIVRLKKLRGKSKPVMSLVDLSRYEVRLPLDEKFLEAAHGSIKKFNDAPEIKFIRETPKKTRELEIKKHLAEPLKIHWAGELVIKFGIRITAEGSIKPSEVLKILRERFNFPADISAAQINRTELLSEGKILL